MKTFTLFFLLLASSYSEIQIVSAINAKDALDEIILSYQKENNLKIKPIYGASGNLVNQILHGLEADIFLSANEAFADTLIAKGQKYKQSNIYAAGKLAFIYQNSLSVSNANITSFLTSLIASKHKIALANPKQAPYGMAGVEVLESLNLFKSLESNLVYGDNIAQASLFIKSGSALCGFSAYSLFVKEEEHKNLKLFLIDQKLYSPLKQKMLLLSEKEEAASFYNFILGDIAQAIFKKYAYFTVNELKDN